MDLDGKNLALQGFLESHRNIKQKSFASPVGAFWENPQFLIYWPKSYICQTLRHFKDIFTELAFFMQGLLDLDGRYSQKYLHQTYADF